MIPTSQALVPLLPERQAALQAIAAVERAQQRGARLARHPYAAAFMKQLSGGSRISVQALNRIRGIYLRPRVKRAPLPEWESALDIFLSTAGEVCPLPLRESLPQPCFRKLYSGDLSAPRMRRRSGQATRSGAKGRRRITVHASWRTASGRQKQSWRFARRRRCANGLRPGATAFRNMTSGT